MNFIFLGLTGSHAYGLETEDSDEDWRGVFWLPTDAFLRTREPKLVEQHPDEDITYWEIKHFFGQLIKGSQNAHELLWLPDEFVSIEEPAFSDVKAIRYNLMTDALWEHWGGFARSYEYDVKKYVNNADWVAARKHAMHYVRLTRGRFHAATEGEIAVSLPEDLRAHLRAIRQGFVSVTEAMDEGKEWDQRAIAAYEGWVPKADAVGLLDDLLILWRRRWGHIFGYASGSFHYPEGNFK